MRKFIITATIIMIMLLLPSCIGGSRAAMLSKDNDQKIIYARFEQIINTIENGDRDEMKALFSEYSQNEAEDIDGEIEQFLDLFPNGIDSWEYRAGQGSESIDHGDREKSATSTYYLVADDQLYILNIMERTVNTKDPEKVGLHSLIISKEANLKKRMHRAGIIFQVE